MQMQNFQKLHHDFKFLLLLFNLDGHKSSISPDLHQYEGNFSLVVICYKIITKQKFAALK